MDDHLKLGGLGGSDVIDVKLNKLVDEVVVGCVDKMDFDAEKLSLL